MPIEIVRNDITKMTVDAIVNAANSSLLGGGGVDGAIHRAAGRELLDECRLLGGCSTGEAKLTKGYKLPCRYIIHTVGPVWRGGGNGEREKLISCYRNSLKLAAEHGCESIAFPLISSGIYGYPKAEALRVAVDTAAEFISEAANEMMIYIVIFDKASFDIGGKMFYEIQSFIDENYVDEQIRNDIPSRSRFLEETKLQSPAKRKLFASRMKKSADNVKDNAEHERFDASPDLQEFACAAPAAAVPTSAGSLEDALNALDESFSEMLLRLIDERELSDPEVYKKANIDRKLFSKIRSNKDYRPKKQTAVAFAIALELDLSETRGLLETAGFALSHSSKFDVIIEYFIAHKQYNIYEINEALFAFDQSLLGQ